MYTFDNRHGDEPVGPGLESSGFSDTFFTRPSTEPSTTPKNSYGIRESINPYWKAYQNASGKKNKKFWLSKAIDWEANYDAELRSNSREDDLINQARERELADRAHTEEYDSPIEQAKRLRAAGINPDLSDDMTAGSTQDLDTPVGEAGSNFAGAQDGGVIDDPSDDIFTSYIMPALSTAVSFIPAVGSAVSAGLNIVNNELLRANQQASVENQTLSAAAQYNSNVDSDLTYLASSAKHLSTQVDENNQPIPLTKERFQNFLSGSNRQWTADKDQLVDSYLNNADIQSYAASKLEERNETVAKSKFGSLEFYDKYVEHQYSTRMYCAQAQEYTAEVQQIVSQSLANDSQYAQDLVAIEAGTASEGASGVASDIANNRAAVESDTAVSQMNLRNDTINQIRSVYNKLVAEANQRIADIDAFIARLKGPDGHISTDKYSEYMALRAAKSSLIMQTYDSLDSMSDNLNNVYRIFSSGVATTFPNTIDNTSPTANSALRRHYIMWTPSQPATDTVKDISDKAIQTVSAIGEIIPF